jgi:hypothetical protein
VAALIAVPLLVAIVWIAVGPSDGEDASPEPAREQATVPEPSAPSRKPAGNAAPPETEPEVSGPTGESPEQQPRTSTIENSGEPAPETRRVEVDEFGVGRRVVNHRIEGRDDRFREGEVVWFLTRVLGARRGEHIRHVWHHEGSPVQSIELEIGGPHWRTQSNKTLWSVGSWTVEARDEDGRVLATAAFTCVPR